MIENVEKARLWCTNIPKSIKANTDERRQEDENAIIQEIPELTELLTEDMSLKVSRVGKLITGKPRPILFNGGNVQRARNILKTKLRVLLSEC